MKDAQAILELAAQGEALDREFKSDRQQVSDTVLFEGVVALANTRGGMLLLGVEDDGRITGARPRHGLTTDPFRLQAAIFGNTVPSINTRVSVVLVEIEGRTREVVAVEVDPYPEVCSTASGKALHRILGGDGRPATAPFYPRDQRSHRIDLGLLDFSAQPVESATFSDLNPVEFDRLRTLVVSLRGDRSLVDLGPEDLAKALRLIESRPGGHLVPNVAGLLLLGREERLRDLLPTHAVWWHVLDAAGDVKVGDEEPLRHPLLRVVEDLDVRFKARNQEAEVQVGLFRLPVPDYSPQGFREALLNALLHRDYARLDAVYVQWHPDHLLLTSPGGFPAGITLDNLLVHEPKPRNNRLAEAFKRIGLIEQTGRGVDRIFLGQLRYGRPPPDYGRSDSTGVRVVIPGGGASLAFASLVFENDRLDRGFSLDELLVLNVLLHERRLDSDVAGRLIQKGTPQGRAVLERLVERGVSEATGEGRGRAYHLSASLYRRLGDAAGYVRSHGLEPIRQEAMVQEFIAAHERITRGQVMELCGLNGPQAGRLLCRMLGSGKVERLGTPPRWTYYVAPGNERLSIDANDGRR